MFAIYFQLIFQKCIDFGYVCVHMYVNRYVDAYIYAYHIYSETAVCHCSGRCSFRLCCAHVPMLPASSSPLGLHQRLCLSAPNIACVYEPRMHSHHLASTNFLLLRHAFLLRRPRESPWPASAFLFCPQRCIVHRI